MSFTGQSIADAVVLRASDYRVAGRLYCRIDSTHHRILLRATDIGAITMPERLGCLVQARCESIRARGPVFEYGGRWTFLTTPHRWDADLGTVARLNSLNVQVVPFSATMLLPSPGDPVRERRRWVVPPRDPLRPAMDTVLAVLDEIAGGHRARCAVDSSRSSV
ncbi:hypothetical protein [Nocardia sp. alder85J]|uniref:hypothetical protein n=1 Tax=Nocardia sp. alder85J TaxID=2862949 RepID=UPI001CD4F36C|nr:hypothetical protein [Nocardia sp. alder85J]MCX4097915.1 hypothetical protein [Nocardia sp. alder85J]